MRTSTSGGGNNHGFREKTLVKRAAAGIIEYALMVLFF